MHFEKTLEQLLEEGYKIMITEHVPQGQPFIGVDVGVASGAGETIMAMHPCDYNYLAYSWEEAHELNMLWLNTWLECQFEIAIDALDDLVDSYQFRTNIVPETIHFVNFESGISIEEAEDGMLIFNKEYHTV